MLFGWVKFRWNLADLANSASPTLPPFTFRTAESAERSIVQTVAVNSLSMDTLWGSVTRQLEAVIEQHVEAVFQAERPACVVVQHGSRIIGVSILDPSPEAPNHLLTGPCVLEEYQRRGIGTVLLYSSLDYLSGLGLQQAYGLTLANSTAARYVYGKFGGVSEPQPIGPWQEPRLAA